MARVPSVVALNEREKFLGSPCTICLLHFLGTGFEFVEFGPIATHCWLAAGSLPNVTLCYTACPSIRIFADKTGS